MILKKTGIALEQDITLLEKELSLKLPQDYRKFLLDTNGGVVEKDENNKIVLTQIDETIVIDVLYGIHTGNQNADIQFWMDSLKDDLMENVIIVGDDIIQGLIVMICDGEDQGIYYWDDAYNFEESCDESNMYKIADSFTEFIQLLS